MTVFLDFRTMNVLAQETKPKLSNQNSSTTEVLTNEELLKEFRVVITEKQSLYLVMN